MILAVGNVKGGVGKTTLAVNIASALALCMQDVFLIDGDQQQTAIAYTELRKQNREGGAGYAAAWLQGEAIRTECLKLAPKYDHIIIDVGGRDTGSLRAALTVADVFLMPAQPRSFDLWAVDQTAALVKEARKINGGLRAIAVINEADPQGTDNDDAAAYIQAVGEFELAPRYLVRRKVYPNAAAAGLSVFEFSDPAQREAIEKARNDLATLTSLLFDSLLERQEPQKTRAGGR